MAALAIVLGHYGRHVRLEELRRLAGVSRDGTTAQQTLAIARHFGLDARVFSKAPDGLEKLGFPLVVQLDFNHLVVLEGLDAAAAHVNDPGCGPYAMPLAEFDERFTGIAFRFRPGPGFAPGGAPPSLPRRLGRLVVRHRRYTVAAVLLTVVAWAALAAAVAVGSGPALAAGGILFGLRVWALRRLAAGLERTEGAAALDDLLRQSNRFFGERAGDRVAAAVMAVDGLGTWMVGRAALAVLDLAGTVLAVAILSVLSPPHGGVAAVAVAAAAAAAWWSFGRRTAPWRLAKRDGGGAAAIPAWTLVGWAGWKFAGRHEETLAALAGRQAQRTRSAQAAGEAAIVAAVVPLVGLSAGLAVAAVTAAGPAVAGLMVLALLPPLRLALAAEDLPDLKRLLAARDDLAPTAAGRAVTPFGPACHAAGMGFGYGIGTRPLFEQVDIRIGPGEQVGLTGPSAAGKSTLARLLLGLEAPLAGTVTRPHRVALVDGTEPFFAGTLRDNLALFSSDVADADLRAVLDTACAWEFLHDRQGLDTTVAQGAVNFSGGQRRRLALARALLSRPALIAVDEAFDGLDGPLEARLRANLRKAGIALLVVSLRAETLAGCDRAWVLASSGLRPWQPAPPTEPAADGGPSGEARPLAAAAAFACPWPEWQVMARAAGAPPPLIAGSDPLRSAARHFGLHLRRVRLRDPGWWRRGGQILVGRLDTGEPVLLEPGRAGYRMWRPEEGRPRRLRAGDAGRLRADAFAVLPVEAGRGGPIGRMALGGGADGVRTVAAIAAGALLLVLAVASATWGAWPPALLAMAAGAACLVSGLRFRLRGHGLGLIHAHGRMWSHILRLPTAALRRRRPSELDGAAAAGMALAAELPPAAMLGGAGVAVLVPLALSTPVVPALAAGAVLLSAHLTVAVLESRHRIRHEGAGRDSARLLQHIVDGILGLRLLAAEQGMLGHWRRGHDRVRRRRLRLDGAKALRDGVLSVAVAAAVQVCPPADAAVAAVTVASSWGLAHALATVLGAVSRRAECPAITAIPPEGGIRADVALPPAGAIAAERVSFTYPGAVLPAVAGVSLALRPGEVVGLTGPSGGGKTTLVRLLLGLEVPDQGRVLVDGRPVDPSGFFALRRWMDVVEQDAPLALATVRAHLAGMSPHPLAQCWQALETVGLAEDVRAMPMGIQSLVSDLKLSLGQAQRLKLARALLARPRVLVLDEATSGLEAGAHGPILAAVRAMGTACLVVSHRADVLAQTDRVVRLGRVEAEAVGA